MVSGPKCTPISALYCGCLDVPPGDAGYGFLPFNNEGLFGDYIYILSYYLRWSDARHSDSTLADAGLVLEVLCQPIESICMTFLSNNTVILFVLTSAKQVGDLHAFSVHPSCIQFIPDGSKVTFYPNVAYLPQVIPAAYSSMAF